MQQQDVKKGAKKQKEFKFWNQNKVTKFGGVFKYRFEFACTYTVHELSC